MLTPERLRRCVDHYVATVNSRDPQAIAALFTEDGVQADPASSPANVGRAAIAAFFEGSVGASDSWTFTAERVHTCSPAAAIDFRIELVTGGASMAIAGIEVFSFDDEGLIRSVHAYWDDANVSVP